MEFIEEREESWKVPVLLNDEGKIKRVLSSADQADDGDEVAKVNNFVFQATLEHVKHRRPHSRTIRRLFVDTEDQQVYPFSPDGVDALFEGIAQGQVKVTENGGFSGLWTFKSIAGYITARPLSRDEKLRLEL